MKVSQAVDFHLQYQRANSKKNTVKTFALVLSHFAVQFDKRDLASISIEEVLGFLLSLTKDNKQATKRNRYSVLASFYNFIINTALPTLVNPCSSSVIKKISSVLRLFSGTSWIKRRLMRSSFGPQTSETGLSWN